MVDEAMERFTEWLTDSETAKQLSSVLASAPAEVVGEGLEEIVSELFEPFLNSLLIGGTGELDWRKVLDAGAVGLMLGKFGSGSDAFGNLTNEMITDGIHVQSKNIEVSQDDVSLHNSQKLI